MCPRKGWEPLGILGGDAQNIRLGPECCREPPGHATTPLHRSPGSPSAGTPPRARVFGGRMFATPLFPPLSGPARDHFGKWRKGKCLSSTGRRGPATRAARPPHTPGSLGTQGQLRDLGSPSHARVCGRCRRWHSGEKGPRRYFGAFSRAPIPSAGGTEIALCRAGLFLAARPIFWL